MIRKLQKRFVRIAVLVLTAAMVVVVGIVNTANLLTVRGELAGTVKELADIIVPSRGFQNQGMHDSPEGPGLPEAPGPGREQEDEFIPTEWMKDRSRHFRNLVSESGLFAVYYNADGNSRVRNLNDIPDLDEDGAKDLASLALESGKESGWIQDYCFTVAEQKEPGIVVVFMNCETRMAAVRNLALISTVACAGGILLAWLLVRLFSRKAVEPTIRNMEQQKQFITNASHELKTPLTVISTNMELLKMENPDNPWIRSTQKQTGALRHLVDELVYLSRMEEENPALNMESLAPGAILREAAEPFQAMAEFNGKELQVVTEEDLRITGDRPSLQRLMSTMLDNAVKYTPEGGEILAEAVSEGKHAVIRVSNTVEQPMTKEQCAQLFNRFYRADESRNKDRKSGFGIGLAIAAAIAEKHGGSMNARMEEDRLIISAVLPRDRKPEAPGITLML